MKMCSRADSFSSALLRARCPFLEQSYCRKSLRHLQHQRPRWVVKDNVATAAVPVVLVVVLVVVAKTARDTAAMAANVSVVAIADKIAVPVAHIT